MIQTLLYVGAECLLAALVLEALWQHLKLEGWRHVTT